MSSETDQLTGLPARPLFEQRLKQAIGASDGVSLALVDLDNFKEINDELGHDAGDALLKSVAPLLEATAPGHAYRLGGDEFALILPEATLEQGFLRMETLRAKVQESVRVSLGGTEQPLTIKVGVAQ